MATTNPPGPFDPSTDPRPLMIAIARMANMDAARIRRMVLTLDVGEVPMLYVESFLGQTPVKGPVELPATELEVVPDATIMVNVKGGLSEVKCVKAPVFLIVEDE